MRTRSAAYVVIEKIDGRLTDGKLTSSSPPVG